MSCLSCEFRPNCKTPCNNVVCELDDVTSACNEYLVPKFYDSAETMPWSSSVYLTKREKQIITMKSKNYDRAMICKVLDITREALRCHIKNLKIKACSSTRF
jgi:DNA-binding CsgD family transcriptional regulator